MLDQKCRSCGHDAADHDHYSGLSYCTRRDCDCMAYASRMDTVAHALIMAICVATVLYLVAWGVSVR